jgi:hypothetical protein
VSIWIFSPWNLAAANLCICDAIVLLDFSFVSSTTHYALSACFTTCDRPHYCLNVINFFCYTYTMMLAVRSPALRAFAHLASKTHVRFSPGPTLKQRSSSSTSTPKLSSSVPWYVPILFFPCSRSCWLIGVWVWVVSAFKLALKRLLLTDGFVACALLTKDLEAGLLLTRVHSIS